VLTFICDSLTEDYNLELQYRKPFLDIWKEEQNDPILGPLSERMGVRSRSDGSLQASDEELEAAGMDYSFIAF
jgi:mRNA (guanine-N7-)-methyltransferase